MIKYVFVMPLLIGLTYYTPTAKIIAVCGNIRSTAIAPADTSVNNLITYKHAKNVLRCTYSGARSGDCLHIVFSCGDFGLSERNLPEKDEQLWSSLYADGPSGVEPNSDMVGKAFEITYQKTSVKACDGSEDLHQVDAPRLIGFKLLQ